MTSGPNVPGSIGPSVSTNVQQVEKDPLSHVAKSILIKGKTHHLERKSSKIFANLEKSKSRTSVFDNNTISTRIASDKISTIRNAIMGGKNGNSKQPEEPATKSSSVCIVL